MGPVSSVGDLCARTSDGLLLFSPNSDLPGGPLAAGPVARTCNDRAWAVPLLRPGCPMFPGIRQNRTSCQKTFLLFQTNSVSFPPSKICPKNAQVSCDHFAPTRPTVKTQFHANLSPRFIATPHLTEAEAFRSDAAMRTVRIRIRSNVSRSVTASVTDAIGKRKRLRPPFLLFHRTHDTVFRQFPLVVEFSRIVFP